MTYYSIGPIIIILSFSWKPVFNLELFQYDEVNASVHAKTDEKEFYEIITWWILETRNDIEA